MAESQRNAVQREKAESIRRSFTQSGIFKA